MKTLKRDKVNKVSFEKKEVDIMNKAKIVKELLKIAKENKGYLENEDKREFTKD